MTSRVSCAQVKAARRVARLSIAGLSVLAVVSGFVACGGNAAPQPTATVTVTSSPAASPATPPTAQPTPSGTAAMSLKVYFMRPIGGTQPDKGPFIASAHRDLPATKAPATAALKALLGGPTARERAVAMSTAIPAGTTLRGLTIASGIATVDLSGTFASGGGTLSMTGRLAQVIYTLTQFPSVTKGVVFKVDGKIVTVFGGRQNWSLQVWKYACRRAFVLPAGASSAAFTGTLKVALSA